MIALRRLNSQDFILNADLIETIETTPDTVISLVNGRKLVVLNKAEEIVRKVIKYKQICNQSIQVIDKREDHGGEVINS